MALNTNHVESLVASRSIGLPKQSSCLRRIATNGEVLSFCHVNEERISDEILSLRFTIKKIQKKLNEMHVIYIDSLPAIIVGRLPGYVCLRKMLLLYVFMSATVFLMSCLIGRMKQNIQASMLILASGICLVLLASTMVTLTSGSMPIFMIAEPLILLATVIGFVFCAVKFRK